MLKVFKAIHSTGPHKRNQGGFWAGCKLAGLDLPWPWKTGDGKLASICSDDEQVFIYNAVSDHHDYLFYWLGLFRDAKGSWRWVDGSETANPRCTYGHWEAGQPDNAWQRQRCVVMQLDNDKRGVWDDIDCATSSVLAAICQIPAKECSQMPKSYQQCISESARSTDSPSPHTTPNPEVTTVTVTETARPLMLERTTLSSAFKRPTGTESLDCRRIISGDSEYIKTSAQSRIVRSDKDDIRLPMDCAAIRSRNYFTKQTMSKEEAQFPIAFARVVYTDYRFLEMEFAAEYTPQNVFCFAVDSKSSEVFRERIHSLANCFPNVVVTKQEYSVESSGRNMWFPYMECFKHLLGHRQHWEYVVTLQTTQEIVQILKWMNGANDVEVYPKPAGEDRVDYSLDWSFAGLGFFRNESRNRADQTLTIAKGLDESAISRAAIEFIVNSLNITKFLQQINTDRYGSDEFFLPTLDASDALGLPGGFTEECLRRNIAAPGMTRYTLWVDPANCGSGHMRHNICVFGMEDLSRIVDLPHLMVNKMMQRVDFGATVCLHELMHYRTYVNRTLSRLNHELYASLPQVRYQTERKKPNFTLSEFDCDSHESSVFFHFS